jgi:hypothetical protein
MRNGKRLMAAPALADVRRYAREQLAKLPDRYRLLERAEGYPVAISADLVRLQEEEKRKHQR